MACSIINAGCGDTEGHEEEAWRGHEEVRQRKSGNSKQQANSRKKTVKKACACILKCCSPFLQECTGHSHWSECPLLDLDNSLNLPSCSTGKKGLNEGSHRRSLLGAFGGTEQTVSFIALSAGTDGFAHDGLYFY